jgi:23S rRNA pseudouridine1911/1915/1917 synthase
LTYYKILKRVGNYAGCVECNLATGRTHQIRVHLSSLGHGLVGDPLYGKASRGLPAALRLQVAELTEHNTRQALHAQHLQFKHPVTEEVMSFSAPLPPELVALEKLLISF